MEISVEPIEATALTPKPRNMSPMPQTANEITRSPSNALATQLEAPLRKV